MTSDQLVLFWATSAQVIPVLALTLVLELRRAASLWRLDGKVQRRVESAVLLATGLVLYWLFGDALKGLRGRSTMQPRYAATMLVLVLFLLALNPLWLGAIRGNADLLEKVAKRAYSLFWILDRRRARRLDAMEADLRSSATRIDAHLARIEVILPEIRMLAIRSLSIDLDSREFFLNVMDRSEAMAGDSYANSLMQKAVDRYERQPSPESATRAYRTLLWVWLEHRSFLRKAKDDYVDLLSTVDTLRRNGRSATVDEHHLAQLQQQISSAGQDFIVPWMPTA